VETKFLNYMKSKTNCDWGSRVLTSWGSYIFNSGFPGGWAHLYEVSERRKSMEVDNTGICGPGTVHWLELRCVLRKSRQTLLYSLGMVLGAS
jgi:hypothetical protein